MEALIVTFKTDASEEAFTAANEGNAPVFTDVDGLLAKIWIVDPESTTYGGIYLFRDRAALEGFRESDLFKGILAEPSFEGASHRRYQVIEELTAKTQPRIQLIGAVAA
jgi:hypothetical protein